MAEQPAPQDPMILKGALEGLMHRRALGDQTEAPMSLSLELELTGELAFRQLQVTRERLATDPRFQEAAAKTALDSHVDKYDDPVKPIRFIDDSGVRREVTYRSRRLRYVGGIGDLVSDRFL